MHLACPGLFSSLEKNTTVVAPNRLLTAVARRQYAVEQVERGRESWLPVPVLSQSAWLTSCWNEARYRSAEIPTLLSRAQELLLWQQVIENDGAPLFDSFATAQLASRAARLLLEWEMASGAETWTPGSDAGLFKRWLEAVRERCRAERWITAAELWHLAPEWASRGWCGAASALFLLSERATPALARAQGTLGAQMKTRDLTCTFAAGAPAVGRQLAHAPEELEFAARWARAQWQADPRHSIAVFVANLSGRRSEIERAFRDVFYSGAARSLVESRLSYVQNGPLAYNLGGAHAAREEPLVAGALQLVRLLGPRLPASLAGAILRSPWIEGAQAERALRARADADLRRSRELEISLAALGAAAARCPGFQKMWPAIRHVARRSEGAHTCGAWAECFGDLLNALKWPGDAELDSRAQDAFETWNSALSQLPSLALVEEQSDFETALAHLERLLDQANSGSGEGLAAPVQILDLADAPGLAFDAALITGLGEDDWPPRRAAMPFLPLGLQRRYELPGSSQASLEGQRSDLCRWLFGCAPQVAAAWHGRLSPGLAEHVDAAGNTGVIWEGKTSWQAFKPVMLEELDDAWAPPFVVTGNVTGGTGIIKSQSNCPFQAYAKYRLGSRSLEEGRFGFDERERGGHLHNALQLLWQQIGSSDNLQGMPRDDLETLVESCAREAIRHPQTGSFGEIIGVVEIERLKEVLFEWLAIERQRLQPFAIEVLEGEQTIELAGIELQLRIDRVDRLKNGGLILIDYKSGIQKHKKLECPRPPEPQMLVYATSLGEQVQGVVFGQLKREDVRPVGWTRDPTFRGLGRKRTVDALGSAWDGKLREWRAEVEQLAAQFRAGDASVDPAEGACDFCEQKILCRVAEAPAAGGEGEGE